MEINAKSTDRNLLLQLSGELDHHAARDAIREIELAIDAALPRNLVVDMEGVTFMDSSGKRCSKCLSSMISSSSLCENIPNTS